MSETPMKNINLEDVPIGVNTSGWSAEVQEMFDVIARRAYELFESGGCQHGHDLEHWLQAESELFERPALTMAESQNGVTVLADVSDFAPRELEVDLEPRRITIVGKRPHAQGKKAAESSSAQNKARMLLETILLPVEVDMQSAYAHLNRGILELDLKKAVVPKQKRPRLGTMRHVV